MKLNRRYEIFNLETGEWDECELSDEEYRDIKKTEINKMEEMGAEYDIVCKIISQNIGENGPDPKDLN